MGGTTTTSSTINAPNTLGDFSLQSTSYGKTIPKVWGQTRIEGNVTTLDGFTVTTEVDETSVTTDAGKGGHIDYTRDYTYTFSANLEIALAEILTAPYSIGWVWEQNRKNRLANSSFADAFETVNQLSKVSLEYEMGTKPALPNFSFEINGSSGDEEWSQEYKRDYESLDQVQFARERFSAASDDYLATAYIGYSNTFLNIVAHQIDPVINDEGGVTKILEEIWSVPDSDSEFIWVQPQTAIQDEYMYVLATVNDSSDSTYGTRYLLTYNLLTSELQTLSFSFDPLSSYTDYRGVTMTVDTDYLFIVERDFMKVRVYDVTDGFPEVIESVNLVDRLPYSVPSYIIATNNNGKLYIMAKFAEANYLHEYYYPTDTILTVEGFLDSPDYPDTEVDFYDFVNDGENLGVLINYYKERTSDESKQLSIGIAYRIAAGSVEYYSIESDQAVEILAGSLTITNGYIAAYVAPTLLGTVLIEYVLDTDDILYPESTDVYQIGESFVTNNGAWAVISENWKGGYYVLESDDSWKRSDVKIYGRPENIYDVNPAEIIEDFLTTDNGLNLSDVTGINVSALETYCNTTGLNVSLALIEKRTAYDIVNELLAVSNGIVRMDSNLDLSFEPYQDYEAYTTTITDDDLIGSVNDYRTVSDSLPTSVQVEFSDRDIEYNSDVYIETNESITDYENVTELTLNSITRSEVAAKVAKLTLQRTGFVRHYYSFQVTINHLDLLPGDYILLNSVREDINQILYITEATESDTGYSLICEEYIANINSVSEVPVYQSESTGIDTEASPGKGICKLFKQSLNTVYIAVGGSSLWNNSRILVSYNGGSKYTVLDTIDYNNHIAKVISYDYPTLVTSPLTANVPNQEGEIVCEQGTFAYESYTIAFNGQYTFTLTEQPVKKMTKSSSVAVLRASSNTPLLFTIPDEYVNSTILFKIEGRTVYNNKYQNSANMPAFRLGGQA